MSWGSVSHSLHVGYNSWDARDIHPFDPQPFLVSAGYPDTPVDKDPPPSEEPLGSKAFGKQKKDNREALLASQSFWYVDYYSVSNFADLAKKNT